MRALPASAAIALILNTVALPVHAQGVESLGTPAKVTTSSIGVLEYKDGVPIPATVQKSYDFLDLQHGVDVYLDAFAGVSVYAARKGFIEAGVQDNQIGIFETLMDAKSSFLTANADVVYYLGFLDLTKGPMVLETPPGSLGTLDDMWFNWVIDFGAPGSRPRDGRSLRDPASRIQWRGA